jgi:hypothetical protein
MDDSFLKLSLREFVQSSRAARSERDWHLTTTVVPGFTISPAEGDWLTMIPEPRTDNVRWCRESRFIARRTERFLRSGTRTFP